MAGARLGPALWHIQRLFSEGSSTGLSDTQLLSRFAARRDEAAFAACCCGTGRWSWPSAGAFCAIRPTPRTPFRRRFSSWPGKRDRCGRRASSAAGCTRWRTGSPSVPVPTRHGAGGTSGGRPRRRSWNTRSRARRRPASGFARRDRSTAGEIPAAGCSLLSRRADTRPGRRRVACGEATLRRRLAGARERLRVRLAQRGFAPIAAIVGATAGQRGKCGGSHGLRTGDDSCGDACRGWRGDGHGGRRRVASLTQGGLTLITNGWKATAFAALYLRRSRAWRAVLRAGDDKQDAPTAGGTNAAGQPADAQAGTRRRIELALAWGELTPNRGPEKHGRSRSPRRSESPWTTATACAWSPSAARLPLDGSALTP